MVRRKEPGLIAVYGFLGSGKTTVMLQLARAAAASGRKVALVVNEAGEIPIDGKLLMVGGMPVKEIFGGCICCSVVGDFIETLRALKQGAELDWILIEPSGMANAPSLFESLGKHTGVQVARLLVLDGPRLPLLLKAAGPLIQGQLKAAGTILLNKVDALTPQGKADARAVLADLSRNAPVHAVSARAGLPESLLHELL